MSKDFEKQLVTAIKLALGVLEKNRLPRALCFPREKRKELRKGQREETETFSPDCCSFAQYFLNPLDYAPPLCFTCPPRQHHAQTQAPRAFYNRVPYWYREKTPTPRNLPLGSCISAFQRRGDPQAPSTPPGTLPPGQRAVPNIPSNPRPHPNLLPRTEPRSPKRHNPGGAQSVEPRRGPCAAAAGAPRTQRGPRGRALALLPFPGRCGR